MKLNVKTEKALWQLVEIYSEKNKRAGFQFLKSVIDILNKDEIFSNYLEYGLDPFCPCFDSSTSYFDNHVIYCNPNEVRQYLDKYKQSFLEGQKEIDVYNLCYLYSLLHESSHVEQNMCAYYNVSLYPEVNQLYKKYIRATHHLSLYRLRLYEKYTVEYAYERNANINASLAITNIYKDNASLKRIGEIQYIYYMIHGYEKRRKRFVSPAEKTLKLLGCREKIDFSSLPFEILITEGLPIEERLYNELLSVVENQTFATISFEEFRTKVRKIGAKRK